jgi:hypothetical protein
VETVEIILYNYNGENNVIGKTLTGGVTVPGNMRGAFDVLNPSISLLGNPPKSNYLYIPSVKRYYFITDWNAARNGMTEISAHVDVLQTYAAQIRDCNAIAARTGREMQNAYIPDEQRRAFAFQTVRNRLLLPDALTYGAIPRYILVTAG